MEVAALNAAYVERFGVPFILCVRRHTRPSVLAQFRSRLRAAAAEEQAAALQEIGHITRLCLVDKVDGPGAPAVNGWLSTHVQDTAPARPAEDVPVKLLDAAGQVLTRAVTKADGRTEAPLLSGAPLRIGVYELRFEVGAYFWAQDGEVAFVDVVPVRFRISEPEAHYHVPLLVSPGAFSSYRGS